MIKVKDLTSADVGKWVQYSRWGRTPNVGRIKHWSQSLVFVVYKCNDEWDRYQDFTAEGTFPEDLVFFERKSGDENN